MCPGFTRESSAPDGSRGPGTELWDLEALASAAGLGDWMFEQFEPLVGGSVAEVGAGIGTFSERILASGAESLLLIEPDPVCAETLERKFGGDARTRIAQEALPDSRALSAASGKLDLIICQNVLEHVADDEGAAKQMAAALRPGGWLCLLVPAHPALFGPLDRRYGHVRRYDRERVRQIAAVADLELVDLYSFNLLGVLGWWVKNRQRSARIDRGSLRAYEILLRGWRPVERRVRPPWGLSLVARARRPR
jgi:SAM-dependent methyltransferase